MAHCQVTLLPPGMDEHTDKHACRHPPVACVVHQVDVHPFGIELHPVAGSELTASDAGMTGKQFEIDDGGFGHTDKDKDRQTESGKDGVET